MMFLFANTPAELGGREGAAMDFLAGVPTQQAVSTPCAHFTSCTDTYPWILSLVPGMATCISGHFHLDAVLPLCSAAGAWGHERSSVIACQQVRFQSCFQ